jgi:hypothetical protein
MAVAESVRERRAFDARALPLAHGRIIASETGGAMSLAYSLFARVRPVGARGHRGD